MERKEGRARKVEIRVSAGKAQTREAGTEGIRLPRGGKTTLDNKGTPVRDKDRAEHLPAYNERSKKAGGMEKALGPKMEIEKKEGVRYVIELWFRGNVISEKTRESLKSMGIRNVLEVVTIEV